MVVKKALYSVFFYFVFFEVIDIEEIYGIVYCATNKINNKKYIGQTVRELERRKQEHISNAKSNGKYAFHYALRNYGEENFEWGIIDTANNIEELDEKERYWIKFYNTYLDGGYNMALGGQCNLSDNPEELSSMRGGREFLVYDLDGNFIKTTTSQTEFAKEIGSCIQSVNNVLRSIKGKHQVKEYILIYKDEFSEELLREKVEKIKEINKPFYVFDANDEFVGVWDNKVNCANELMVSRNTIYNSLVKSANKEEIKIRYPNKYKFYYLENTPSSLENKIKEDVI